MSRDNPDQVRGPVTAPVDGSRQEMVARLWLVWAEKFRGRSGKTTAKEVNEIPDYERVRIMGAVRHIKA